MAGTAARRLAAAADFSALPLKPMYDGTAIASRMPRMMITTRSSMRVKPPSVFPCAILFLSLSIESSVRDPISDGICQGPRQGHGADAPSLSAADGERISPELGTARTRVDEGRRAGEGCG